MEYDAIPILFYHDMFTTSNHRGHILCSGIFWELYSPFVKLFKDPRMSMLAERT